MSAPDTIDKKSSGLLPTKLERKRRHRVPYSEQEIQNLMEGVRSLGKFWGQIIATYDFHPSRTAVDLMEKFKRLTVSTFFQEYRYPIYCTYYPLIQVILCKFSIWMRI